MKKKKVIIIILILGFLLISTGITYYFINLTPTENITTKEKDNKKEPEKELINPNIEKNEKDTFKEEHCLDNICIEELNVLNELDAEKSIVDGILINKSSQIIPAGYIKIEFNLEDGVHSEVLAHNEIPANGETVLSWYHKDKNLINSTNYKLVKPTDQEIAIKKAKEQAS